MKVAYKNTAKNRYDASNTIFESLFDLPTLKQMTDMLISEAISRTKNLSEAAQLLGISRQSLSNRIKRKLS